MSRWRRHDRGSAMVMFAITLTVLLGISGFAVDLGLLFSERRQDQSAADTGAIGGAIDLSNGINAATEEAAALIRMNLPTSYTDAEWTAQWAACTDPSAHTFTGTVLGTPTQCMSFDGLQTFRVVVPQQEVPTAFARVLGIESFSTGAAAETEVTVDGIGGVLPFAVLGSASSGSQLCMRSSTSGTATPPCTGSASGNFGALEVPQWGNPAVGTEGLPCNLNKTDQLTVNISVGLDHFVREWDGTDVVDSCSKPFGPNTLSSFQGIAGGIYEGFITGDTVSGTGFTGRLTRGTGTKIQLRQGPRSYFIDDIPLWLYIGYGKTGTVPATCVRESIDAAYAVSGVAAADTLLAQCLLDYAAGTGYAELFDYDANGDNVYDIVMSPRFGVVPQFHETGFPSGGSANMHISGFRAVFIHGLQFGCNGTSCSVHHTPGKLTGPVTIPNGSSPLDQITGYLIPYGAIPNELVENGVNGELGAFRVRLSG